MDIKKVWVMFAFFVIVLLGFKFVDRYAVIPIGFGNTPTRHPIAYKLDRWTGKLWLVRGLDAYVVKNSPLSAPEDGAASW